jgi:hypothetical protein
MAFGTLKADTLTHSTAGSLATNFVVQGSAKAFCHFSTDTTQSSFNVSSTVDAGTGQYKSTYTNSMSDAEQCVTTNSFRDSDQYIGNRSNDNATTHHQMNCFTRGGTTRADTDTAMSVAHGDLA